MNHVSIIMLACNRPQHLLRTLRSWVNISYRDFDFVLVDNNTKNPEIQNIALSFQEPLNLEFFREDSWHNMCVLWDKYGQASEGDYVIFAMQDEIVCGIDVVQKMMEFDRRASIFTYFMNQSQTSELDSLPWQGDPSIIPLPFTDQTTAGLISHIHGNWRKNWDWFGWFRNDERGHLWLDQDVHLREVALGVPAETPKGVYCLHQYHNLTPMPANFPQPGYRYKNELQARLLEPAERDS